MKKWQKIENKINAKLERVLDSTNELISGKTPEGIRVWKKSFGQKLHHSKERMQQAPLQLVERVANVRNNACDRIHQARISFHEKIAQDERIALIAIISALLHLTLIPLYKKISLTLQAMKATTLATGIIVAGVTGIVGIGVMNHGGKIAQEAGLIAREPASIKIERELRPKYYKRDERELLVANIIIPAYIEKVTAMRKLQVDFSIISSNRYIREYFYDNTHLVEDVFNSRIEPMIPGFPLNDEGKRILKDKVKEELNALLARQQIKGSIESVYISSILAD